VSTFYDPNRPAYDVCVICGERSPARFLTYPSRPWRVGDGGNIPPSAIFEPGDAVHRRHHPLFLNT